MIESDHMGWVQKYRKELFFFFFFLIVLLASRLYNISSLPIFTDEAIYTRWSQIAYHDASWRFISLTDGKQPSFVWLTVIFMRFIKDPLLAGRLVSVAAGVGTYLGLFFLAKEIFKNKWVGLLTSMIYVIYPMALVYDRMALYDSLVGTFSVWGLYLVILLVRKIRLDIALILGMVIGAGVLTKSSGFFTIYLLPFSLLLFDTQKKERTKRFFRLVSLAILASLLGFIYYSILRLSPFFHIIAEKNATFIYPFRDWLSHPFTFFIGNMNGVIDWLVRYMTIPILLLVVAAFIIKPKEFLREKVLLAVWFAMPFMLLALFGKVLYPRFIFFMTLSLLPLLAYALYAVAQKVYKLKKKNIVYIMVPICNILVFALMIRSDYYVLTNFAHAPIPFADLQQYFNDWPAGGGVREVVSFLQQKASTEKIYVLSEGTFGSVPTLAVEIYLGENKNIDKRGIYPLPPQIPPDLLTRAKTMPVYVILNQTQMAPNWPLKFIAKYQKGIGNSFMSIYQVDTP